MFLDFIWWFGEFPETTCCSFQKSANRPVIDPRKLTVDSLYNDMVLAKLPNLESLVFGPFFNGDAQFFPENLQHLTFGKDFNRSLMRVTRL